MTVIQCDFTKDWTILWIIMLDLCPSHGLREVTTLFRSEEETIREGKTQEEAIKADKMWFELEKFGGLEVMRKAETEFQLHEEPQEGKNDDNLENVFLNLIEKCNLEMIADGNADTNVTGQTRANIALSVEVHIILGRIAPFQTEGKRWGDNSTIA